MIADWTSGLFSAFTALTPVLLSACSSAPGEIAVRSPAAPSTPSNGFTNFETRSPADGVRGWSLFVCVEYAADRLFDAQGETLRSIGETTVGLRPVALALRGNEAWVVNHLSDSINVEVSDPNRPRVVHTLQVGDEPRGIVIAG